MAPVVLDSPAANTPPQLARKRLQRDIHVRETGIAAGRRNLERTENARARWLFRETAIGMPDRFTVAEASYRDPVLDDVRDHRELRVIARFLSDMHRRGRRKLAKAAAECEQLGIAQ